MKNNPSPGAPLETDPLAGYHYEHFETFLRLALDPTMTYSCAYFATGKETLQDAQMAKVDLAFKKIGLKAGQRLLDIGCGWGYAVLRANEHYGATAVGLTVSKRQHEHAKEKAQGRAGVEFRLQGWESYREPCDHIVCFGAFEYFGPAKHAAFFERCRELLPSNGRILLEIITVGKPSQSFELLRFTHFLHKEFYPAATELPKPEQVVGRSREAGLELLHVESLRAHYPLTLDTWKRNLEERREQAIRATDLETYQKLTKYLTGSAKYLRSGETNVYQFLFGVT